jgi:hypothetical protein
MKEDYIVVCGAIKYHCSTQEEVEQHLCRCANNGAKEVRVYQGKMIDLTKGFQDARS